MSANPHARHYGFTLAEMLVSLAITGMTIAAVCALFIVCVRIWNYCSAQSQSFPPAYIVVQRINMDLKNAISNKVSVSNSITNVSHGNGEYDTVAFYIPQTDGDGMHGTALWPLTSTREISYYPVQDTASPSTAPYYTIYRRERNISTNTTISNRAVAAHALLPIFKCDASISGRVFSVYSTVITILGQERGTHVNSTFTSAMSLRNPSGS